MKKDLNPWPDDNKDRKWMEITTVVGCPVRCAYCPQDKFIREYRKNSNTLKMTLATFKKCIDKLPKEVDILFAGFSEPFLNPECSEMILYANKRGFNIEIFTTCVGMTIRDIELIKGVNFKGLVHLPSDRNDQMYINVNTEYLGVLTKLFESNDLNIHYFFHQTNNKDEKIHPKIKELAAKFNIQVHSGGIISRASNINSDLVNLPEENKKVNLRCNRLNKNILLPNGDVVLCCMDWGLKHRLGNLLESDYESLFKSKEFLKVLDGLTNYPSDILCRRCECVQSDKDGASIPLKVNAPGFFGRFSRRFLRRAQ